MTGALATAHENPRSIYIPALVRTHNRIRSPRLAASGQWNKVGKGSRQNRSVTLGKGLALRVGLKGLSLDVAAVLRLFDAAR